MKKLIDITETAVKGINALALNEDRSWKNLVERNLEAMGAKGISYLDLWQQCEALTTKLQQLSNQ